jgi:hypothetical protein
MIIFQLGQCPAWPNWRANTGHNPEDHGVTTVKTSDLRQLTSAVRLTVFSSRPQFRLQGFLLARVATGASKRVISKILISLSGVMLVSSSPRLWKKLHLLKHFQQLHATVHTRNISGKHSSQHVCSGIRGMHCSNIPTLNWYGK